MHITSWLVCFKEPFQASTFRHLRKITPDVAPAANMNRVAIAVFVLHALLATCQVTNTIY